MPGFREGVRKFRMKRPKSQETIKRLMKAPTILLNTPMLMILRQLAWRGGSVVEMNELGQFGKDENFYFFVVER